MAAVFVGKERLFGASSASINGLECTLVQSVSIKKNGSVWVRKFIRTNGGDGSERIKTALRVAKAVYNQQKPDLVQVSVLDQKGPTMRSDMRGRAVAAQVVFIPDVKKLPNDAGAKPYSAYYYDGAPSDEGVFYGLRVDLPLEDTEKLATGLNEFTDCIDLAAKEVPSGHDAPAKGHDKPEGGHGESGGHGEAAPAAADHAPESAEGAPNETAPAAAAGHAAVDDPALLTSTPEHDSVSIFSFAYVKSLIFGKGPTEAVAAEPAQGQAPIAEEPAAHDEAQEPAKSEH